MYVPTWGRTDQSWVQHSEEIKRERYNILIDKLHILTMKFFSLEKERMVRILLCEKVTH